MPDAQDLAERVRDIVAEELRVPIARVRASVTLGALGADDAAALRLAVRVGRELHVELPERLRKRTTWVSAIIDHVANRGRAAPVATRSAGPTESGSREKPAPSSKLTALDGELHKQRQGEVDYAALIARGRHHLEAAKRSLGDSAPLFLSPHIPIEKLKSAARAHDCDRGGIFLLLDLTFWGSATNSILFGTHGVSLKVSDEKAPLVYPWKDIDVASFEGGVLRLLVAGRQHAVALADAAVDPHGHLAALLQSLADAEVSVALASARQLSERLNACVSADGKTRSDAEQELRRVELDLDALFRQLSLATTIEDELEAAVYLERAGFLRPWLTPLLAAQRHRARAALDAGAKSELRKLTHSYWRLALSDPDRSWARWALHPPLEQFMVADYALEDGAPDTLDAAKQFLLAIGSTPAREFAERRLSATDTERLELLRSLPVERRSILLATSHRPSIPLTQVRAADPSLLARTGWSFPLGHPDEGTFYRAHPLRPETYIPITDFHHRMFEDRWGELQKILSAVGATEVDVEASEGIARELFRSQSLKGSVGGGGVTQLKGSAARAQSTNEQHARARVLASSVRQAPRPTRALPAQLIWYPHEPTWISVAEAALEGRIEEYTFELHYAEDFAVNEKLRTKLEAELSHFASMSGELELESESFVRELRSSALRVRAKFPRVDTIAPPSATAADAPRMAAPSLPQAAVAATSVDHPDAEVEYLRDLNDIIVDGKVPESSRRMLRRSQQRLGLDEETVSRLEARLLSMSRLSSAEREYVEELQDCYDDGKISTDERRMLTRHARRLDISDERASELEAWVRLRSDA